MAIYSLNLGFISRSEGRSAVGFSAYISGSLQQDMRTGVSYNYGCKEDVIVSRILAPEDAPDWAKNASTLWNKVEAFEDTYAALRFRGNARDSDKNQKSLEAREHFLNTTQTAQTIMGALPKEFTQLEAEACVEEFLKARFVSRGLVVEYAIHWDKGNPHFHGLITRRTLEDGEFAHRKDRDIVSKPELLVTRKAWEDIANKHLALGGYDVRIDSRSYADQGLALLPTHHEGWYAQRLAERGEYSRIVSDNEDIRQRNIEILCKNPGTLIHEVSLKRTVFTRKHIEDEIIRRVGGDEKLFALLQAKVEDIEVPPELILKQANDNRGEVFEGEFAPALQNLAAQFTDLLLENGDVVTSVGENLNREKVFASAAYKKQEEHILALGETLYQRPTKTVSDELISKSIEACEEELGFALSEEQRLAIGHLCAGPDISILNGKAGTGKTTLLKAVAEAYQEAGYRVLGTSFQGKAVEIMEQEIGITCKTMDTFKYAWEKHQHHKDLIESGKLWGRPYQYALRMVNELESHRFTAKDVIIVDEANMVGNHLWEAFLNEATEKGAKVLIVQDPAQIKSREPGDTGRLFAEKFGFCETSEVVRQRIPWQRECSQLLNDHQVLDGLKPYDEKGYLRWAEQSEVVIQNLTQDYVKDLTENPNDTRMALAYRNSEVYTLNQSIREVLIEQGYLQEHFKIHGEEYSIGDQIRFTQNDHHGRFVEDVSASPSKGVKNGTFGTIEGYDENNSLLTVCLDNQRSVQFNVNDYKHITHGYAMGIHKSEGSTFDRSFVSFDPMMDPSTLLVSMTRHRQDVQVFINREQFVDFKALVDRIGSPHMPQTIQDYQVSEEQNPAFERVQHYRDLIVEAATLREEMEGDTDFLAPLYKHPSYATYKAFFEEKKQVAVEILKDWQSHGPYVRMLGIRKDVLEVEAGLRPRPLSDLEHRASLQVQGYMDLVNQTKVLWKTISQTHPGVLAKPHALYEDYAFTKAERDSLASVIQENPRLYSPFFKVTKDEPSGEATDYWGEKIEDRVCFASVKSHAEAHHRSQLQNLFHERLSHDQKAHYDEVKAYVSARNEAAALYSHLKKQETESVQVTQPHGLSLDQFHEKQAQRDALALKVVESPEKYQAFFAVLKVKEEKLLAHAVTGELREKVQTYATEQDISRRASQAQELKRILITSGDYRIYKESGLDVHRMTFDIAFHDKLKSGEIPNTLHPDDVYKPIQSYLNASRNAASLWKTVQLKGEDHKRDWEAALQARNENAKVLAGNQVAIVVLGGMSQGYQQRVVRQAEQNHTRKDPIKPFLSADSLLEASRGRIPEIINDILGAPNPHLSTKTTLRFGTKGSLAVHHAVGLWKDFESGDGGNIIQLIQREKGLSFKETLSYLGDVLKMTPEPMAKSVIKAAPQQTISHEDIQDRASRLNAVSELQMKSKSIGGTLAETYLQKERGIQGELPSDLRYLPKDTTFMYQGERKTLSHNCLAAFGRTENGSLSSVQLTKLDDQGNRAITFDGTKLTKIQYGLAKGSFVCLQDDNTHNRVFIAEGVETALSLKDAGLKGRIVASMGIHNISNYQGPEKEIILCGDTDDYKKTLSSDLTKESQTQKLLETTKERFQDQGKSVHIVKPSHPGDDFNDVLKKQGIQGVQAYLKPYLNPEKEMQTAQRVAAHDLGVKQSLVENGISRSAPSLSTGPTPSITTSHSTSSSQSIDMISDYIQSKMNDIKNYDGTSLAQEAKEELRDYLKTLQKNEPLFQALKEQNKELTQEVREVFQQQIRIRNRGIEM